MNKTKLISIIIIFGLIITTIPVKGNFNITDTTGNTVEFNKNPKEIKIYSWSPNISDTILSLQVNKTRIVGIANASGTHPKVLRDNLKEREPPDKIFGNSGLPSKYNEEEWANKFHNISEDVVIAPESVKYYLDDHYEEFNITPVYVKASRAEDFKEIYRDIRIIGDLTGKIRNAEEITNEMKNTINNVQEKVSKIEEKKEVVSIPAVSTYNDVKFYPSYPDVHGHSIIEKAGMKNLVPSSYPGMGFSKKEFYENLIDWSPDAIIHTTGGWSNPKDVIMNNYDLFQYVEAVKKDNFYGVEADLMNQPGPQSADAVEVLARKVYPEAFMEDENEGQGAKGVGMRISSDLVKVHQSVDNPRSSVGLIREGDTIDVTLENDEINTSIQRFNTTFNEYLGNVYLNVNYLNSADNIPKTERAYGYTNISLKNADSSKINNLNITFKIEKPWLVEMNASKSDIILKQYDNNSEWRTIETKQLKETENGFVYKAKTNEFGLFTPAIKSNIKTTTKIDQDIANSLKNNAKKELYIGKAAVSEVKPKFTRNTLKYKNSTYESKWKDEDYAIIQINDNKIYIAGTHRYGTEAAVKYYQKQEPKQTTLIRWRDQNNDQEPQLNETEIIH